MQFDRIGRIAPAVIIVIVALASAGLFFQQSQQRYVIDEAEFPLVAKAISETGIPQYYRGEDLPENIGIWHPPLYPYTLAIWQQAFGSSHSAVRAYGLFCALLSAVFGLLILHRLFPACAQWLGAVWLFVFLLHPYVIQSALLPDIDTTALVAISMIILWLLTEIIVARRWSIPKASMLLGFALGVAFLAKLTTPTAFVPLIAAALLLASRSWRVALAGTLLTLSIATVVFTIVWGTIAGVANLDFAYPFTFTWDSVASRAGHQTLYDRIALLRPTEVVTYWLTPLLLGLFMVGAAAAVAARRSREGQALLLAAAFAVVVFFTYNVITGSPFGFPKYYAPAMGAATLVAVSPLGLIHSRVFLTLRGRSTSRVLLVAVPLCLLASLSFVLYARRARTELFPGHSPLFIFAAGAATAAGLAFLVHVRAGSRWWQGWALVSWSAILLVLGFTNLSASLYQRSASASLRYCLPCPFHSLRLAAVHACVCAGCLQPLRHPPPSHGLA